MILNGARVESDEEKARAALSNLCRLYWRPVFLFVVRRGFSVHDAQDITQDFFAMILETNWLRHANASRGRFRSLLLSSLQNFLKDVLTHRSAHKRGGRFKFVAWDDWMADAGSDLSIPSHTLNTLPPEHLFDLRWAATIVEQALRRLGEECEKKGRRRLFDALSAHLVTADRTDGACAQAAALLCVSEQAAKAQLHNLRQRYRWLLRDEVSRTVSNPADVDDEIRHLCAALAKGT